MDVIYGGSGNDHLVGELGSDTAYGGAGNDIIAAAADPEDQPMHEIFYDYSYGGEGADTIYAVDGYRDEIYCGKGGNDKAYFDVGLDTVKGCEYRYPLLPPLV
jgi:Ca2+-binding RTX toxin-like protein